MSCMALVGADGVAPTDGPTDTDLIGAGAAGGGMVLAPVLGVLIINACGSSLNPCESSLSVCEPCDLHTGVPWDADARNCQMLLKQQQQPWHSPLQDTFCLLLLTDQECGAE